MEYFEAVAATYQLQALKDRIETENKLRLYDESVKSIFQAIINLAKSAITLILKIILGIKNVIVGVLKFVYKTIRDKIRGDRTDIYSVGGGSGGTSDVTRVGHYPQIIKASNLKNTVKRVQESMRKYGGMRDGEISLRISKRLKNIVNNENGKPLSDETINEVCKLAVQDIRFDIDKVSNGAFVISKDISGLIIDMVKGNILSDRAYDGTKYSELLKSYPFDDLYDIEAVSALETNIDNATKGKYNIYTFFSGALCNTDSILLSAIILQASPLFAIKLNNVNADISKITDSEISIVKNNIKHEYSEILEGLSDKSLLRYLTFIYNKNARDKIDITEISIIQDSGSKFDGFAIIDNKELEKLSNSFKTMAFTDNTKYFEKIKDNLDIVIINNLSDSERCVYDIVRNDVSKFEMQIYSVIKDIIADNKLDLEKMSKTISKVYEKGKLIRDEFENMNNDSLSEHKEFYDTLINRSINITMIVSKITGMAQTFIKNVNSPFYKKILEDISIAVQSLYYLSAISDADVK